MRPSPGVAAAMSGAVDLSALKDRAQAPATSGGGSSVDVTVTEANFETEVLQRSDQVPVVVVLTSSRSDASLALADAFGRLAAADNGSWVLARVDVDSNMRIAQAFGVQSIPTTVAVAAGQPLADLPGVQPEPQLRQWVDAILRAVEGKLSGAPGGEEEAAADPRIEAAENALADGDLVAAKVAYEAILAAEPENAEAKAALRQVNFLERAETVAVDAVALADAAPDDVDLQLAAADAEMFAQLPEAAFSRLIGAVSRTAGDERTRLRTRLIELFELFDAADPIVVAARRKLALALF